ncbi:hypothetical protein [Nitrosomonas sp. Nm34]|uniref:hypothetical protein n=1 Tax=Nitrosomonas sp. Nm34 TaxID=1881055 RepID=UPI001113BE90|nr:hypothetical protein [Nitrosomonas sp. Nm34]
MFTEAIATLKSGLDEEPTSPYAHDRLAKALKSQEEEEEKFRKFCKEGRILIRNPKKKKEKKG